MVKTTKVRVKAPAHIVTLHNREEVELAIKKVGDLNRELQILAVEQNNKIANITEEYAPLLQNIKDEAKPYQVAIQAWCESNRAELTKNGKTKTAEFNTGTVSWRVNPPSCAIRGVQTVLENLKRLGFERFIRIKEEINKEAMLNEPEIAQTVAGVTIKSGIEEFIITPFEQKAS